ncbi:tetratricopeptide repeat-containing sensor histidine kinase [uncultured Kordia sp.]|uniref:ATP-binding protein n=1 Tax=uncultured Kordia sp. TaxID=507699 RepID=UPI0026193403|nr:tetratricopeptide repeat-containing sensor histidine kinase [uncultured Kordia sp.]
MKAIFISTTVLFFFFSTSLLFSQQEKELSPFQKEIQKATTKFNHIPYFKKATSFFLINQWDSTLVYSAKQLIAKDNSAELINYCHFFRGFSFRNKGILNEAKEELAKISQDFLFYNHIKITLGGIAFEKSEFEKAIQYYKIIDSIEPNQLKGLKKTNIEENIGSCYLHLNQYEVADNYFQRSISLHEKNKDTLELIGTYGNIATSYYNQYLDDKAIPYFEKAYALSQKIDDYSLKLETANNMAVVENNRKNFEKALQYTNEVVKYKDILNDRDRNWAIGKLEKELAVNKKQEEVNALALENKLERAERDRYLYAAIILLLLLGTVFYFYREKVKSNKIIVTQKENLNALNAMKDKLFSVVSHDLRSSVYALKTSNTELSKNLEAKNLDALDDLLHTNSSIVNGAYNLLDNLLHWALLQTEQSYFEMQNMHLFFMVEQTVYNYKPLLLDKKIQFENKVPEDVMIVADQESLKIVLRNLIDNAIKFSESNDAITIYTRSTSEKHYDLVIEDTGLGMSEATRLELLKDSVTLAKKENKHIIGTGLGMQLCKSMIQKNKGKFTIESELGKGTKMIVSLLKNLSDGSN